MDVSERRESLVRLLRRRHHWTVADLAAETDVSRRTALRDLAALRDRGYDIRGSAGPGGGVYLDPRSVLVSSQLVTGEVVALVLSVAVARAASWLPFASGAERALAKLEGALPATRRDELARLRARILVGDPTPGVAVEPVDPALLVSFEHAFRTGRLLHFTYVDRVDRRTDRRVEPHALLVRAPRCYIVGWDLDADGARLFRMDRVRGAWLGDEPARDRPLALVTAVCPDARPPAG